MCVRYFFQRRTLLATFLTAFLFFTFAQNILSQNTGKYPALLWEISGNGLAKPSYLYGTMHVSSKLAFHLSDSFFVALKSADIVALETNPSEWLQNMKDMGMFDVTQNYSLFNIYGGGSGDFYSSAFKFEIPDNKELGSVLASDPDLVNGLLYRSNDMRGNHEENTYLDLFIFQSARKLDKPVTNLEDFKESEKMVQEAMVPDPNEQESVQKYYKDGYENRLNIQEKIENAYRKGDLDALDSLSRVTYPSRKYEKYMLHLRNEIMVRGMDSIMRKQVLFTGIGAAHLPGDKGVIELLRKKGYKVRPVNFKVSKKSMKEKEQIEQTIKPLPYSTCFAPDSFFKADVPGKLIETTKFGETRYYLYPEMINGAYFMVARIKTFAAFNGQDQEYCMKRLDSLFYENIPGKIIKHERITANNGWPGYDILNQTRRGDFQRYKIFAGPQEIFVFKMGGTGQIAKSKDADKFFGSITFIDNNKKTGWLRFSPPNGGFSAELPQTVIYEKPVNKKNAGAAEKLQAYDPLTGDFYIAMRAYYNDFSYIEEDTFELNLFLTRFLEKKNFEVADKKPGSFGKYPMLAVKLKSKSSGENLYFNFYLKGPHYYMLGAKTKNNKYPEKYFNSFRFEDFRFTGKFKDSYDSTMYFTVNDEFDNIDESLLSNMMNANYYNKYTKKKKKEFDDSYDGKYLEKNYFSPSSNEAIKIEYRKFNDYRMEKNKDEFWKNEFDYLTKNNGLIIKEKMLSENNGSQQYDLLLTDTASTRGINSRLILKNGVEYILQCDVDTLTGMSYWQKNFFTSFHIKDSVMGKNIFEDKVQVLLDDLISADSSRKNAAINSSGEVIIGKEHLNTLFRFIDNKNFNGVDLNVKAWAMRRLGDIKDDRVIAFLQKQYSMYSDTATMQFAILAALASQQKEQATKVFLDLLQKETPLTNDDYEISGIFRPFYDSLIFARPLFPGLLSLTKFEEYKPKVYALLAACIDEKILSGTIYANEKAIIQNEANYELKRFNSNEDNSVSYSYGRRNGGDDYDSDYNGDNPQDNYSGSEKKYKDVSLFFDRTELENYALLLLPYYNEAQSKSFFDKINRSKNDYLLMNINLLLLKNKLPVNDTIWSYFAKKEKTRLDIYDKLEDIKRPDKFEDKYKNQEDFCRSILYGNDYEYKEKDKKEEKDSIIFVAKKRVKNKKAEGYVYFFKRKDSERKEWRIDYVGLQPLDEKKVNTSSRYQRKELRLYEDKTIEEQMNDIVNELNLKGRQRVTSAEDYTSYLDY